MCFLDICHDDIRIFNYIELSSARNLRLYFYTLFACSLCADDTKFVPNVNKLFKVTRVTANDEMDVEFRPGCSKHGE